MTNTTPGTITVSQEYWNMLLRAVGRIQEEKARELFWVEYLMNAKDWKGYW